MKTLKLDQYLEFSCTKEQLNKIKGGITRAEFQEVCKYLWENGHYDQLAVVMKMYDSGDIQFED